MWYRKWRETKQQPSRARSGHQSSCCLVPLHFLCDIPVIHEVVSFASQFQSVRHTLLTFVASSPQCTPASLQQDQGLSFPLSLSEAQSSSPERERERERVIRNDVFHRGRKEGRKEGREEERGRPSNDSMVGRSVGRSVEREGEARWGKLSGRGNAIRAAGEGRGTGESGEREGPGGRGHRQAATGSRGPHTCRTKSKQQAQAGVARALKEERGRGRERGEGGWLLLRPKVFRRQSTLTLTWGGNLNGIFKSN